jgi:hypothetical protein
VKLYSVTVQWETRRESQMVQTMAVLASYPGEARDVAVAAVEERTGYTPEVLTSSELVHGLKPRVVAELALDADDKPYWVTR